MTGTVSDGFLRELQTRRDRIRDTAEQMLLSARAAGRTELSAGEAVMHRQAMADLRDIDQRIDEISGDLERRGDTNPLLARLRATTPTTPSTREHKTMSDFNLTYRARDRKTSWIKDLILTHQQMDATGEARARLARHARKSPIHRNFRSSVTCPGWMGTAATSFHLRG